MTPDTLKRAKISKPLEQEIHSMLKAGETVTIPGLGNFKMKHKEARQGRNPATGEAITVAARNAVTFSPALDLKKAVNA